MITTRRNAESTIARVSEREKNTAPVRARSEYDPSEQTRKFNEAVTRNFENLLHFRRDEGEEIVLPDVTAEQPADAAPAETVGAAEAVVADFPTSAPAEDVAPARAEEADLMPSSTTMQFRSNAATEEIYRDIHESAVTSYKINAKGKVLLAVYMVVIVTLFALIILNTRALRFLDADVSGMQDTVAELQKTRARLTEQLEYESSDENIMKRAEDELGMLRPSAE